MNCAVRERQSQNDAIQHLSKDLKALSLWLYLPYISWFRATASDRSISNIIL